MTLTVPEAARRIERDLANLIEQGADSAQIPPEWQRTFWGDPMPDVLAAVRRSRSGH